MEWRWAVKKLQIKLSTVLWYRGWRFTEPNGIAKENGMEKD
jgi:hypothetical protein